MLDNFVYATTSPVYVSVAGRPPRSPEDARYFIAWIDRLITATEASKDWNTPAEKDSALKELHSAREVYLRLAQ